MGGIGISLQSQDPSKPVATLPSHVVEDIANKLGISANVKDALAKGRIDIPENVDIKVTRLSDPTGNTYCTVRKDGAEYTITHQGRTVKLRA